ncbi:putative regulator of septum formation [Georgenia soli]|uniref:Putative regulator of septum formation n=1 Tax=Georgenia soli TaxID=638953 RepID=A0A2A9ELE7_9MICO|nr:septum formation family protein [Georgenia soli]PFG39060.1 putative regulator of septum formation [Georgenia soli]
MRKTALAALALAGTFALAGCSDSAGEEAAAPAPATSAAAEETQAESETVDAFDVEVGDCILYPEEQAAEQATGTTEAPAEIETVSCDQPHDSQVYTVFDLPGGDFPGDDEIIAAADERCGADFEGFVGNSYDNSVLDIEYFFPSEESWNFDDDREVACMVYHMEGEQLTASAEGSAL